MNIADFIAKLFCHIDDTLPDIAHHNRAVLSLSELVTIGVLQAMKNVSQGLSTTGSRTTTATPSPNCPTVPGSTSGGLLAVFIRLLRDVQRRRYGREYLG